MGVVHLALDPQGSMVAVKVLRPETTESMNARLRLAREVETMRRVRSPFVAEVLDADVTGEFPYIVTRYVPGPTLEAMVRSRGPLSGSGLRLLAYGTAEALTAIHAAGVVHRDLKPGNVMLADDRPVVIDFGIAQSPDATRLTQDGLVMGTPGYLAPEVIEGLPAARPRTCIPGPRRWPSRPPAARPSAAAATPTRPSSTASSPGARTCPACPPRSCRCCPRRWPATRAAGRRPPG